MACDRRCASSSTPWRSERRAVRLQAVLHARSAYGGCTLPCGGSRLAVPHSRFPWTSRTTGMNVTFSDWLELLEINPAITRLIAGDLTLSEARAGRMTAALISLTI